MLRTRMLRRKTVEARTQTYTWCEPAQWKCTSTCHKSHTIRKFTGENAADQSKHPDQAPAFTPTVRTPQCGLTVWGINRQTATACKRVTSGLLDLSLARAYGHPGTTRSTGTRAHEHNPDPRANGDKGRQDLGKADTPSNTGKQDKTPSNTGTHAERQWETKRGDKTSKRRTHHPTQAHVWEDNGRQRAQWERRGDKTSGRWTHHPT